MRVDESWQARVCMRVFSTFVLRSKKNKSCMRVDKSAQELMRVGKREFTCMRVFSTFVPRSKENKSCMRVDKSAQELMRVGKREFACMRVFSTFVLRSKENKSCMRVDKSWRSNTSESSFDRDFTFTD